MSKNTRAFLFPPNLRAAAVLMAAVFLGQMASFAHDVPSAPEKDAETKHENFIHWPSGFDRPGEAPKTEDTADAKILVRIVDTDTGLPTPCRVSLVGSDGNYYEPSGNPLERWSLHRTGNRRGKGPFRYYGWFFYTQGEFEASVPHGKVRVEVAKGYEYRPVMKTVEVKAGETVAVDISLDRTLDMATRGWYSGDPHIHLDRKNDAETSSALDLIEAEDIRFGFLLAMNDPSTYTGTMETQTWPQDMGMGRASMASRGIYTLSSGQEYRSDAYGHILLLLIDRLVFPGKSLDPNDWPLFDEVVRDTHDASGVALHAHGGYWDEIFADYVHGAGDAIEILQFAVYRGIGLEGWYHILNAGYRLPMVGASDYPYCRALGDSRTYVQGGSGMDAESWTQGLAQGKSFVTTGPMLLLKVNGENPGSILEIAKDAPPLQVEIEMLSEVAANECIEIIVNGHVVERIPLKEVALPQRASITRELLLTESMWISARVYGKHPEGLPDSEAHTNPVYVYKAGQRIHHQDSVDWLVKQIDTQLLVHEAREFEHKTEVLRYFQQAREKLLGLNPELGIK